MNPVSQSNSYELLKIKLDDRLILHIKRDKIGSLVQLHITNSQITNNDCDIARKFVVDLGQNRTFEFFSNEPVLPTRDPVHMYIKKCLLNKKLPTPFLTAILEIENCSECILFDALTAITRISKHKQNFRNLLNHKDLAVTKIHFVVLKRIQIGFETIDTLMPDDKAEYLNGILLYASACAIPKDSNIQEIIVARESLNDRLQSLFCFEYQKLQKEENKQPCLEVFARIRGYGQESVFWITNLLSLHEKDVALPQEVRASYNEIRSDTENALNSLLDKVIELMKRTNFSKQDETEQLCTQLKSLDITDRRKKKKQRKQ